MSEHSAAPEVSESAPASAGSFAFVSRLLQRLKRAKPAATESTNADAGSAEMASAPASGRFAFVTRWLRRRPKAEVTEAAAEAHAPTEAVTDESAAAQPSLLARMFDSPLKIVLAVATALLLLLLIALVVVLLSKKKPKAHLPAAAAPAAHAPAVGHVAATPKLQHGDHPPVSANAGAPPDSAAHGTVAATDPLAEERAKLEQMKAELDKQRQQLEQERKAFAEQAGHAANGSVIGSQGSAATGDIAGSCDLSGDKQSLRENLRRCLGLPEKKPEEAAAKDTAEKPERPAAAPAHKAAGGH